MKVTFDIDCTPAEARAFFGLPDVEPLQEKVLKEIEARMMQSLAAMDTAEMMKTWMPPAMQGVENLQRFWAQFSASALDPNKK